MKKSFVHKCFTIFLEGESTQIWNLFIGQCRVQQIDESEKKIEFVGRRRLFRKNRDTKKEASYLLKKVTVAELLNYQREMVDKNKKTN